MNDKVKKIRPWYAFFKAKRKATRTRLDTGVVVERTKIGGIENINVIDPEVVEPLKRPSFFISENLVKPLRLWKRN